MLELKPCPYRVHGERRASLTVPGEFFYYEYFMPCMGKDCPSFVKETTMCWREGVGVEMSKEDDVDA